MARRLVFLLMLLAAAVVFPGVASASNVTAAKTRIGGIDLVVPAVFRASSSSTAEEHRGSERLDSDLPSCATLAAGELGAVAPTAAQLETAYINQGFAQVEAQTMAEVQTAIDGGAVGRLQDAFRAGESVDVVVGNRVVTVEPGAPFSGFIDMEGNTYAIGRDAFASEEELVSTMLHETYRLNTSVVRSGQAIGQGVASAETATTFDFAQRAVGSMKK